jgi:hypothetical protein
VLVAKHSYNIFKYGRQEHDWRNGLYF